MGPGASMSHPFVPHPQRLSPPFHPPSWYNAVEDYFGPAYGPVMAGPVFAWALHMFFYHTHSAIYAVLDSHKGPWTKLKVSSFDKLTYSQMLPNVIKNQLIFLVSGGESAEVKCGTAMIVVRVTTSVHTH